MNYKCYSHNTCITEEESLTDANIFSFYEIFLVSRHEWGGTALFAFTFVPPFWGVFLSFYIAIYTWSTLASSSDILSLMNFFQSCLRTEEPSGPKSVSPVLLGAKISISFRLLKYIMGYMWTIIMILLLPHPPYSVPKRIKAKGSNNGRLS